MRDKLSFGTNYYFYFQMNQLSSKIPLLEFRVGLYCRKATTIHDGHAAVEVRLCGTRPQWRNEVRGGRPPPSAGQKGGANEVTGIFFTYFAV